MRPRFCGCGCGAPLKLNKNGIMPRFLRGHVVQGIVRRDTALDRPYFDADVPLEEIPAGLVLDSVHATEQEREAVEAAYRAVLAFETELVQRQAAGNRSDVFDRDESAEGIIARTGLPWQRQVTLLSAVVRLARERGITFRYASSAAWNRRVLAEVG